MPLREPSNLSDLFLERVRATPAAPAYRQFENGAWLDWRWSDIAREVGRWQTALAGAGLKPASAWRYVYAIASNGCCSIRRHWAWVGDRAVVFRRSPDNMVWCLNDAGARLLLLEDASNGRRSKTT